MPPIQVPIESNRACDNATADRVVQLFLAGRRWVFYDQAFLGRRDPDAATIAEVIDDKQKAIGPELVIAGLAVVQFCHLRNHGGRPGNANLKNDNVELRAAVVMQRTAKQEKHEIMEGSEELDHEGIGTAEYMDLVNHQNTFDIGCAQPALYPATYGVEAARPRGSKRVIGLVHRGVTQVLSPAEVELAMLMDTDI